MHDIVHALYLYISLPNHAAASESPRCARVTLWTSYGSCDLKL